MDQNLTRLISMIDAMPFACAVVDENFHIKYLNFEMSEFLGFSSKSIQINDLFTSFLPLDEVPFFTDFVSSTHSETGGGVWQIFKFKGRHGECHQLMLSKLKKQGGITSQPYFILLGIPMANISLDTALEVSKNQDHQNEKISNKYQNIFNNANIGIIIFDNDNCIEEVNQTFAVQFDIRRQDVIGKKIFNIFPNNLNKKFHDLIKKVDKDNNPLVKDVVTIQQETNEHTILEISLSKFRNPSDPSDKKMMILQDITKEIDTHEALIQSEKLALTGRLAASLAHEINNPLQVSIGCLGLVDEILDEDDRQAELGIYINMALDELKRGARIVKKLRDLHRKSDPSEKTPIDLKKMINDVLILAKNQLYDRNIVPIFLYQGLPPLIMAVRDQIQSVILNIVINAVDAMPNGGYIYIDLDMTEEPEGIRVKIRDTGRGMDQNVIDHLFDPFFTTKEEGVGLGVYLCNEIINNHDGFIKVESEVGKGSIFSIWLPKGDIQEGKD